MLPANQMKCLDDPASSETLRHISAFVDQDEHILYHSSADQTYFRPEGGCHSFHSSLTSPA
jgi:hypothetical protein